MTKCDKCGHRTFPWFEQDAEGHNLFKKPIWPNIFHVDFFMLIIIVGILMMAWSYSNDTKECRKMMENPCKYYSCGQINSSYVAAENEKQAQQTINNFIKELEHKSNSSKT